MAEEKETKVEEEPVKEEEPKVKETKVEEKRKQEEDIFESYIYKKIDSIKFGILSPKLIQKIKEGNDVVHISRFGKTSISDDAGWLDRFGNNMFTFLVNTFFGGNYTDSLNGFRIIRRKIWDDLKTDAQFLNIEQQTCIRCAKRKIPIYEIDGREPRRIGGTRKMRPLTVGGQLSYQIIKEFIFWK